MFRDKDKYDPMHLYAHQVECKQWTFKGSGYNIASWLNEKGVYVARQIEQKGEWSTEKERRKCREEEHAKINDSTQSN